MQPPPCNYCQESRMLRPIVIRIFIGLSDSSQYFAEAGAEKSLACPSALHQRTVQMSVVLWRSPEVNRLPTAHVHAGGYNWPGFRITNYHFFQDYDNLCWAQQRPRRSKDHSLDVGYTATEIILLLESSNAQGTSVTRFRSQTSCPPMTKRRLLEPRVQAGDQIQRVWQS